MRQVDHLEKELHELIALGKSQGYLTYDQVNDFLPDEAVNLRTAPGYRSRRRQTVDRRRRLPTKGARCTVC